MAVWEYGSVELKWTLNKGQLFEKALGFRLWALGSNGLILAINRL